MYQFQMQSCICKHCCFLIYETNINRSRRLRDYCYHSVSRHNLHYFNLVLFFGLQAHQTGEGEYLFIFPTAWCYFLIKRKFVWQIERMDASSALQQKLESLSRKLKKMNLEGKCLLSPTALLGVSLLNTQQKSVVVLFPLKLVFLLLTAISYCKIYFCAYLLQFFFLLFSLSGVLNIFFFF